MLRLFDSDSSGNVVCRDSHAQCVSWLAKATSGYDLRETLPACPCHSGHARIDNSYETEHYYESDPQICLRSKMPVLREISRKTYRIHQVSVLHCFFLC